MIGFKHITVVVRFLKSGKKVTYDATLKISM